MPLNSVQTYVNELMDGLLIPGNQNLKSFITPPSPGKLDGPMAFLGDIYLKGSRESMPRGFAFKNLVWTINVYLSYATNPNGAATPDTSIDQQFPLIADAVLIQMWSTKIPVQIKDPTTDFPSRVMSIGEVFTMDKPRVRTVNSNQMLYYAARLSFELKELVKG